MEVFVPDAGNKDRREQCEQLGIGLLYSPHRPLLPQSKNYIIDNGAYPAYLKGERLNTQSYFSFLSKVMNGAYHPPYFVVIPDIVRGGMDSWKFSLEHIGKIPEQFKKYFVVQDGMYADPVEWILPNIDGLFIGGSTSWKWRTAKQWIDMAHDHGKKCHIGRVGTQKNYLKACSLGADSVDGSTLMRHNRLIDIERWRATKRAQSRIDHRYENLCKSVIGS